MKVSTPKVLGLAVWFVLLTGSAGIAQQQVKRDETQNNTTNQYSALALELLEAYQPPPRIPGKRGPTVLRPSGLRPEHLTEKYRTAWEELLLARLPAPRDSRVGKMSDRIIQALDRVADTNSVPVLAKAFRQTTGREVDQSCVVNIQKRILGILTLNCSADALEAILTSLDLADERYGGEKPKTVDSGLTLRESTLMMMMQTDNPGESASQKEAVERSKKWHSLIQAYKNPGLSPKNREFLDKAKAARHSEQ